MSRNSFLIVAVARKSAIWGQAQFGVNFILSTFAMVIILRDLRVLRGEIPKPPPAAHLNASNSPD
jgi:hypothetical protein